MWLILFVLTAWSCSSSAPRGDDLGAAELAFLIPLETQTDDYFERANALFHEEVQRRVADCMNAAGFEYVAHELRLDSAGTVDWTSSSIDFAEANGFGQADRLRRGGQAVPSNPNQDYIDSLSPAGQQAYWDALGNGAAEGCSRSAFEESENELGTGAALQEANALIAEAESSAEVLAAEAGWSFCMKERGFGFESHSELAQHVYRAFEVAVASDSSSSIAVFRELEVEVATANHHCGTDYRQVRTAAIVDRLATVDTAYDDAVEVWSRALDQHGPG